MLILKIIGLVLLGILAFILLVLLLVLFVPIRYSGTVVKNEKAFFAEVKATWLLGLVAVRARYEDKAFSKSGRVGFIRLFKDKKKKTEPEKEIVSEHDVKDEEPKEKEKKGVSFIRRLYNLYVNRKYVKRVWDKEKDVILGAIMKIKGLLKQLLPRKVKGWLRFGFDDPATTGQVLGLIAVIYSGIGNVFTIRPEFEEKILECDLKIKGRIRIITVVITAVSVYFNKELKRALRGFVKLSEEIREEKKDGR